MKSFFKYVIQSILIGIVSILLINFVGQWFSFHLPFNPLSVFLVGFFHLPGLIVLLIILIL